MYRSKGFTLIELMIVVIIVSILVAVAYPSYRDSVLKSRRTEGQSALLICAAAQERYFTTKTSYGDGTAVTDCNTTSSNGYYTITVANPTAAVNGKLVDFTATATATTKGKQNDDTNCASMTLNQAGTKKSYNSGGTDTTTTAGCWSK